MFFSTEIPDEEGIENFVAIFVRHEHPQLGFFAQQFSDTIDLFRDKPEQIL